MHDTEAFVHNLSARRSGLWKSCKKGPPSCRKPVKHRGFRQVQE